MADIVYKSDFPEILKPEFSGFFNKFAEIIPNWVNTVMFYYATEPENHEAVLEVLARPEYRIVEVVVYAQYLEIDNLEIRQKAVLHEFCHIFSAQLHRQALNLANLLHDDNAKNLAYEGIRCANEALTEDMTLMVWRLMNKISELDNFSTHTNKYDEADLQKMLTSSKGTKIILNTLNNKRKVAEVIKKVQAPAAKVAKPRKKVVKK